MNEDRPLLYEQGMLSKIKANERNMASCLTRLSHILSTGFCHNAKGELTVDMGLRVSICNLCREYVAISEAVDALSDKAYDARVIRDQIKNGLYADVEQEETD